MHSYLHAAPALQLGFTPGAPAAHLHSLCPDLLSCHVESPYQTTSVVQGWKGSSTAGSCASSCPHLAEGGEQQTAARGSISGGKSGEEVRDALCTSVPPAGLGDSVPAHGCCQPQGCVQSQLWRAAITGCRKVRCCGCCSSQGERDREQSSSGKRSPAAYVVCLLHCCFTSFIQFTVCVFTVMLPEQISTPEADNQVNINIRKREIKSSSLSS